MLVGHKVKKGFFKVLIFLNILFLMDFEKIVFQNIYQNVYSLQRHDYNLIEKDQCF